MAIPIIPAVLIGIGVKLIWDELKGGEKTDEIDHENGNRGNGGDSNRVKRPPGAKPDGNGGVIPESKLNQRRKQHVQQKQSDASGGGAGDDSAGKQHHAARVHQKRSVKPEDNPQGGNVNGSKTHSNNGSSDNGDDVPCE